MKKMKNAHGIALMLALAFGGCAAEVGSLEESLSAEGGAFWTGIVHSASATDEPWSVGVRSNLELVDAGDGTYRGQWYQGLTATRVRAVVTGERFVLRGDAVSGECREIEVGVLSCRLTTPAGNQATEITEFSPEFGVGAPLNPEGTLGGRCPWTHMHACGDECCILGEQGCDTINGCYWLDPSRNDSGIRDREGLD